MAPQTISEIYVAYKIPPFLQTHLLRVAAVAELICDHLNIPVDKRAIMAACLLHDMGNILKFKWDVMPEMFEPEGVTYWQKVQEEFKEKHGADEHLATQKILEELKVAPKISELINSMGFSKSCLNLEQDFEQKICSYADQRVAPHGVVSLAERLAEGKIRYADRVKTPNPETPKWTECIWQLEKQIFEKATIKPGDIVDQSILFEKLKNFQLINPKIIIFDMDGVLIDSVEASTEAAINFRPGLTVELYREVLCGNFHEEIKKVPFPTITNTPEEAEKYWAKYSELKSRQPMYAGTKELVQQLHGAGHILVLNTSALKKNCQPLLERQGLVSLFDFIADAEVSKSKVEKFKLIEEKYAAPKENLIFITDTLGDIREADEAGIPTIAVTWGAHDRSYFTREPHTNLVKTVDSVAELAQALVL